MLQSAFPSQLFIKAQARQSFSSLVAWHWSFLLSKLPFPLPQSKFASCPTLTLMIWTTELSASQRIFATWFSHTYSVKTHGNEYNKQLLDEVIVISGKIKVEGNCYQLSRRPIHLPRPCLFRISPNESKNHFIVHCFETNNDKYTVARNRFDLALGNHALSAQSTD